MALAIRAATLSDALDALSEEIAKREAAGETNYVFCEDRLTLLAERAILRESGGTFLSEVTTFARYLSDERPVLSKEGSVMKINELITKRKGEGCFTGASARAVYETIAQLSASMVDAKLLLSAAETTDGMLKRKLGDLAALLQEYNAFLHENGLIDENGYLALLPEKIQSGNLSDVNVFFFAFPSFTKQALEGVRAAFRHAKSVTGIFIGGEEALYTERALHAFLRIAKECNVTLQKRQAPSALLKEGKAILKGVYSPIEDEPIKAENICIFEAQDEAEELEKIAALIKKHVSEGKRYLDISVLVPGSNYYLTAEKVFSSYKIPFYLERKRALTEHPFAQYVLSILEGVASGPLPEDADRIAASVCFGEADLYRNYLLRFAFYRGGARREIKKQEEIEELKREKLTPFSDRMHQILNLFPFKASAAAYVKAVRELFALTEWDKVLEKLKADAGEIGEGFSPAEITFLERDLSEKDAFGKTLLEIERVVGTREFGVREFASLLKSGLDANEVLLIPPSLDAVFIGDATECMLATTPILFAAGLTDNLPVVSEDTAIISDKEIKRLSEIRVEIEPAIQEVNMRKRESFALNLASFSERLYLSRPVRLHGEETRESEVLSFVRESFKTPPMPEVYPYDRCEFAPATLKLIRERERQRRGKNVSKQDEKRYRELREALAMQGFVLPEGDRHAPTPLAAQLWMRRDDVSPTLLESYFECPYAGFVQRGLALTEQREGVTKADAGTFVHAVLESVAKEFNTIKDPAKLQERVRSVSEALLDEPRFLPLLDTNEGLYVRERLMRECLSAAEAAWKQVNLSSFQVTAPEEKLSIEDLHIKGTADRVDEVGSLVRVVDYKTGYYDDSPLAYYTGRKLQLELYLVAASKCKSPDGVSEGKSPAGAFYFPAADVFHKEGDTPRYVLRGFYNAEDEVLTAFDTKLEVGQASKLFDGARVAPKAGGNGMSAEDFADFLQYGYFVAQQAEEEMKQGNYAPSPYGKACERCRYQSLCAFTGKEREESNLTCREITAIAKERKKK